MAKASYTGNPYQRRSLYGREPAPDSLKAAMEKLRTLSRSPLVERNSTGVSTVCGEYLKPSPVLNTQGITPTPSTFDGRHGTDFILWMIEIKCYFWKHCIPETMRCGLVVSCLRGGALFWYNMLNLSRRMEGKGKIKSWPKLETHMRKEFTLSPTMSELQTNGENLKQTLLNLNKNAKTNTQPLLDMKPKLKNIEACLEPKPKTTEQVSLKTIIPHTKMSQPVCKKSLVREKLKCFHCQGVGHLRKACPSTKTHLEVIFPPVKVHELPDNVEREMTTTIENEDLLVESSLVCIETVESGNIEDKIFMESCTDVVVKNTECFTENPCEEMSRESGAYTDEGLNLTETVLRYDACTVEPLHTIDIEPVSVPSLERKGMNPILVSSMEEEHSNTRLCQTCDAIETGASVQVPTLSTYQSPLDIYISKRLQKPLGIDMGQFMTSLDGQECGSPIKNEPTKHTPFVYQRIPNFISHIKKCPKSNPSYLRGPKCVISMPHFHSYMLKRMQVSLVHMNAIPYTFETKTDHERCNLYQIPWSHIVESFEDFRSLKYFSWVLSMMLSEVPISEMQSLFQYNNNSPTIFDPGISKLSIVSTLKQEHQRQCCGLSSEGSKKVKKKHESPYEPLSCLHFLIGAWVWLLATYLTWKVAWQCMVFILCLSVLSMSSSEHGTVIYALQRQFLLVFDPGGGSHDSHMRMQRNLPPTTLSMNGHVIKESFSFIHQNLRTNSFEQGEFGVESRGRGLSF